MHDSTATGNDFFKCDFCRRSWADDLPMVEGHQGSLICARCLTVAYTTLVVSEDAPLPKGGATCTLCLEERTQPEWRSPLHDEAVVCLRCVKQSATTLEKDPDFGWKKPERA